MSAAAFIYQTPNDLDEDNHDLAQLVFGINGISKVVIDGQEMELDQNKGCLIPSGTTHSYCGVGENLNLNINFHHRLTNDLVKRICEVPRFFSLDQSMQKYLQFCAIELPEYKGSVDIGNNRFCQNIINVFTGLLCDRLFNNPVPEVRFDFEVLDRFVNERLHQKITVEELAKCVYISPSIVSHKF